ncbi:hypothetical protein [Streptomyces sp. 5-10]|uniref:hypothetical protein n=1 Tax=Streptomyces sp. 5-10 TaxID=878925 RepID=UPI00168BD6EB|nr:hypothetical protein [Streptomyces sp. 5-10]MBD3004754.1 hypothetical protein [Streptomyces sp. 5-10]
MSEAIESQRNGEDSWQLSRPVKLSGAPRILAQTKDGATVAVEPDGALFQYRWSRRTEMWVARLYGTTHTPEGEVRAKKVFEGPTVEGVFESAPQWVVDLVRKHAPDGWPHGTE